ncbi:hypothetical protein K2173_002868 [Erythroxylum novogranatense]|uniref:NB-ARC domain-containing protein n=1 Tax=Erythroxylum novogranatense TaxID=1862640 RepID=A0AAV8SQ39_9ROSI|nr:hypothetical protein K2173_002868 [Erythroxylum novogranatense]
MAQEIERYQMGKFSSQLHSKEDIPLFKDFSNLEIKLKEKMGSSSPDRPSLRDNLFEVNDCLNECLALPGKHPLLSAKLRDIQETLRNMLRSYTGGPNGSSSNGNVTSHREAPPNPSDVEGIPRPNSRLLDPDNGPGVGEKVQYLEELLIGQGIDEKFKAIGITGAIGSENTKLFKKLLNRPKVKDHFLPRIRFYIPSSDKDSILRGLLDALGVKKEMAEAIYGKHGTAGLCCALNVRLVGKRYLIVLDDARDSNEWFRELSSSLPKKGKYEDRLAYGLPKGHGGTVIVTSRDEKVAESMVGERNVHVIGSNSFGMNAADPCS